VIPSKTLDVTQVQVANAKAPIAMAIRQSDQPVDYFMILSIELALVAVARLADAKSLASNPYANTPLCYRLLGHFSSARWPHHFF